MDVIDTATVEDFCTSEEANVARLDVPSEQRLKIKPTFKADFLAPVHYADPSSREDLGENYRDNGEIFLEGPNGQFYFADWGKHFESGDHKLHLTDEGKQIMDRMHGK